MHKDKYAIICKFKYAEICRNMHKDKYAIISKFKYAEICTKYHDAKICSDPISISSMHSYAFICTKYAKICKICRHEIYMQHMQKYALPTLLMKVKTQS